MLIDWQTFSCDKTGQKSSVNNVKVGWLKMENWNGPVDNFRLKLYKWKLAYGQLQEKMSNRSAGIEAKQNTGEKLAKLL